MSALFRNVTSLLLIALLGAAVPAAAIVTVGPDTGPDGCSYRSIQQAVNYIRNYELHNDPDTVDHYIAIAGSGNVGDGVYNEKFVIDGDGVPGAQGLRVDIFGGYDDTCTSAVGTGTEISAGGSQTGNSVIEIKGNATVYLHDLILSNGDVVGHGAGRGGGIHFHGSGLLDLTNVEISGNAATDGGAIFANGEGSGLAVGVHDSPRIENNTATGAGGAINFSGHGTLQIDHTQFTSNAAAFGGGLYVDPDTAAVVTLGGGVSLFLNTATYSGGAIFVKGGTTLAATGVPQALIGVNTATGGYGGGVYVEGPARASLAADIFSNTAQYGGGIAAVAGRAIENGNVVVTLAAPGPNAPVNVSGNTATLAGGGVYLKPIFDTDYNRATLCASDFRFDLNQAQEGTAIYADEDFTLDQFIGGDVHLNAGCAPPPVCVAGSGCNEISGNIAATADFQPTGGSTILLQTDAYLAADRVAFQQNTGGHVLRGLEIDSENTVAFNMDLSNCLITDNQVSGELIALKSNLEMFDCTLAHDAIGTAHAIQSSGDAVVLENSILNEGLDILDFAGNVNSPGNTFRFLLTDHFDPSLTNNPTNIVGIPHFVNPAGLNYRLLPDSPGLDAALGDDFPADLDGYARDVDLPLVPNYTSPGGTVGVRDIGAYELQLFQLPPPPACARNDTIFCNAFE